MPSKKYQSDSQFELDGCSEVQQSSQHYNTISYEVRLKLIELVTQEKLSVIKASKQLSLKLSTAKFIVNCYKKKGKIMKKKCQIKKEKLIQNSNDTQDQKYLRQSTSQVKLQQELEQKSEENSKAEVSLPIYFTPEMFYYINYGGFIPWQNYPTINF